MIGGILSMDGKSEQPSTATADLETRNLSVKCIAGKMRTTRAKGEQNLAESAEKSEEQRKSGITKLPDL